LRSAPYTTAEQCDRDSIGCVLSRGARTPRQCAAENSQQRGISPRRADGTERRAGVAMLDAAGVMGQASAIVHARVNTIPGLKNSRAREAAPSPVPESERRDLSRRVTRDRNSRKEDATPALLDRPPLPLSPRAKSFRYTCPSLLLSRIRGVPFVLLRANSQSTNDVIDSALLRDGNLLGNY